MSAQDDYNTQDLFAETKRAFKRLKEAIIDLVNIYREDWCEKLTQLALHVSPPNYRSGMVGAAMEMYVKGLKENSDMDMIAAANDTLELARKHGLESYLNDDPELCFPHLVEMVDKMDTNNFSSAKIGRWLGWLQASVVYMSNGRITLSDMKAINRKYAD